jgi:hypothetical protein
MKRKFFLLFLPVLLISLVSADDCSITNLASCISQSFFNFLFSIITAPLQALLDMIYNLLTQPVNIDIFSPAWAVIVYILSMFYGVLLMYSGVKFIVSGYSASQREKAKSTLTKILIMMVLVQASYYLYSLANEVSSSVTTVIMNMVNQSLFKLTADNIASFGLQLALASISLTCLLTTLIFLALRYIVVSVGVILFPIGIFLYFIGPFEDYGRLIINFLFIEIGLTFFYAVIFLASASLLNTSAFQNMSSIVMISAFSLVNLITIWWILFVLIKSAQKATPLIAQVSSIVQAVA